MENEPNEEIETQETPSVESHRRNRRFGVQAPLYKQNSAKVSSQLSPDEYHDALERQLKYQETIASQKRITPKHIIYGIIILLLDLAILQLPPYVIKMIGIYDQVLLGEWLVGLVGVITVAAFIYIFRSGR